MILMSMFSVFDPSSYLDFNLNWMILFVVMVGLGWCYYLIGSSSMGAIKVLKFFGGRMFSEIGSPNYLGIVYLVVGIFLYLAMMNLLGLFPFIFTATAHPVFTIGVGFVMWVTFFIMGWSKNFNMSAAHLVPEGSPLMLSPLMVLIESISHLMRPFTLSVRLAANMMAGHLIIGLLSMISSLGAVGFFFSFLFQSILFILEIGVSVIQGFVFSILLMLYSLEYY